MQYLNKVDTALNHVEDVIEKLNRFCCNFSLEKDKTATTSIAEPNKLVLQIIERTKRIESNLSRVEVYVLIILNLPSNQHVRDLISLKNELASNFLSEEVYRLRKSQILDNMVEYSLTKFRPTPFFSLITPANTSRASILPSAVSQVSLEEMLNKESEKKRTGTPMPLNKADKTSPKYSTHAGVAEAEKMEKGKVEDN